MNMRIWDFEGAHEASNISQLETVLQKRYRLGVNGFWLSHDNERYPCVSLLVNGDLACLHYFPTEPHPGFLSQGSLQELNPDEWTIFFLDNPDQEQEMPNSSVIHFSKAVEVARDFFSSKELPISIEWLEL
jgi:hypothetical protein